MITFLEGELAEKEPARIVLNVAGIGYELLIPISTFDKLPPSGTRLRILTWLRIAEDAHTLYGFTTDTERKLFLLLMNVSGIGPKTALAALNGLSPRDLKAAIATNDIKRISSISGIGKKTAERIVLELKDKITDAEILEATAGAEPASPEDLRTRDAILALISLGYKQTDAQTLIRQILPDLPPTAPVQEIIRRALAAR